MSEFLDRLLKKALALSTGDTVTARTLVPALTLTDFVESHGKHVIEASKSDLSLTISSGCVIKFIPDESDASLEGLVLHIRNTPGGQRGERKLEAIERVMSLREDWIVPDVVDFVDDVFKRAEEKDRKAFENVQRAYEQDHPEEKLTFREWIERMQNVPPQD